MKKRIALLIVVFSIFSKVALAQFEVGLIIPVGLGITFPTLSVDYRDTLPASKPISITKGMNLDLGVMLQLGYNFALTNVGFLESVGLFFDTGYYIYSYETRNKYNDPPISISFTDLLVFHSINVGLLPKINFGKYYSVGLGGGVRIPLAADSEVYDQYSNFEKLPEEETRKYNYSELKDEFKYLVSPYIKLTFEGKIDISKRVAFSMGSFFIYDFGMEYKTDEANEDFQYMAGSPYIEKYKVSSFSVGFLLGLYFK